MTAEQPRSGAVRPVTVFYVVGQPRSGSTFVGDWVARKLNIINAGEVWQTFRAMDRVVEENFTSRTERWADPDQKAAKRAEIEEIPFWSDVFSREIDDPYAALIAAASEHGSALVDTSKTNRGIARYEALGCSVVVVHTIRAFSTWSRSVIRYRKQYNISVPSRFRLLRGYFKLNRRYRGYVSSHSYHAIAQENLEQIDSILNLPSQYIHPDGGYLRCEAFGTRNFSATFKADRASQNVSFWDYLLYQAVGFRAGSHNYEDAAP